MLSKLIINSISTVHHFLSTHSEQHSALSFVTHRPPRIFIFRQYIILFCTFLQEPRRICLGQYSTQRRKGGRLQEVLRDDEVVCIPLLDSLEQLLRKASILEQVRWSISNSSFRLFVIRCMQESTQTHVLDLFCCAHNAMMEKLRSSVMHRYVEPTPFPHRIPQHCS